MLNLTDPHLAPLIARGSYVLPPHLARVFPIWRGVYDPTGARVQLWFWRDVYDACRLSIESEELMPQTVKMKNDLE